PLRAVEHRAPPLVFDVALQQHPVMAVVVGGRDAAVDLGGGEDESAPLAEGDDVVKGQVRRRRLGHLAAEASRRSKARAVPGGDLGAPYDRSGYADLRVPVPQ